MPEETWDDLTLHKLQDSEKQIILKAILATLIRMMLWGLTKVDGQKCPEKAKRNKHEQKINRLMFFFSPNPWMIDRWNTFQQELDQSDGLLGHEKL